MDIPLEITDMNVISQTQVFGKVNFTGVNVLLAEDNELNTEIAAAVGSVRDE